MEGGWGARLDVDNTALSIVTTTQALRALRAVRTPYTDPAVGPGLKYISEKVRLHPRPMAHPQARGVHARYVAFGLLGLTTWDEGRHDSTLHEAQRFCVDWLAEHELPYGGWSDPSSETSISLTATSPAIRGLERICGNLDVAGDALRLARRARDEIVRVAQGGRREASWAQSPDWRDPSVASTALAVLALTSGDEEHRDRAQAGTRWLMKDPPSWGSALEFEERLPDRQWTHMSFALALRAVVGPAGQMDPTDRRFKPAVEHLHRLWSEEHGAWCNGRPGRPPTTSGSQAVISATETLRRAWRFDPLTHLRRPRRTALPTIPVDPSNRPLQLSLHNESAKLIDDSGREVFAVDFGKAQRQLEMLRILVERHRAGAAAQELKARTVGADELGDRFGIKADSVRRNMDRLNKSVRDAQEGAIALQVLVEDREADGEPGVIRWGLTVDVMPCGASDVSVAPADS